MNPRIGIPTPTSIDLPYNQRSWPAYANAVSLAGGEPVEFPLTLTPDEREALAATCQGFLLPGSPADVDPSLYDTPRLPACGPQDAAREQTDFALLAYAAGTGKPLLGICYGCQSMNVFHGGSLIQDLSPLPVNHSAGASVAIAHSVLIPTDSTLAAILSTAPDATPNLLSRSDLVSLGPPKNLSSRPEAAHIAAVAERPAALLAQPANSGVSNQPTSANLRLPVNTSHHQSVAIPGRNLRIAARCPDDEVIEAIELILPTERPKSVELRAAVEQPKMFHVEHSPHRFLLGVQWHPERSVDISPASQALFQALITAAKTYRA